MDYPKEAQALAHFEYSENPDMNGRENWLRSFAARLLRDTASDKFEHMRPTEPFPDGGCFAMCGACRLEARASEIEREGK